MSSSNSLPSEDEHPMLKVSINSIPKHEAKNSKRKLISEMSNLLTKLMKHKYGWVFCEPVDGTGLGLEDYLTIVKKPMNLRRVRAKLGQGLYHSPLDFAEDVRLTFNNAMLYCPAGSDVHIMAKALLSLFEEEWVSIEEKFHNLLGKVKPAPTPETLTTSTAIEKPREEEEAHHVDNWDLTLEEKRRLCEEIQDLPCDKMETVVEIMKKSIPELSLPDYEIELDIDSLDIQTLWELYRFVNEYKESLSDQKEDAEHNINQEPTTLATGIETSRVNETDCDSGSSSGRGSDTSN